MSHEDSVFGEHENGTKMNFTTSCAEKILKYLWNCILLILSLINFKLPTFWTQTTVEYKLQHFLVNK